MKITSVAKKGVWAYNNKINSVTKNVSAIKDNSSPKLDLTTKHISLKKIYFQWRNMGRLKNNIFVSKKYVLQWNIFVPKISFCNQKLFCDKNILSQKKEEFHCLRHFLQWKIHDNNHHLTMTWINCKKKFLAIFSNKHFRRKRYIFSDEIFFLPSLLTILATNFVLLLKISTMNWVIRHWLTSVTLLLQWNGDNFIFLLL